jgi:arylsulfatase A-like enzyme
MFVLTAIWFVAGVRSLSASEPGAAVVAAEKQPNIVLFFVDDFGQRDLSCYGSQFYETPQMDQLAADGMRFTNAYSAYARCVSSRTGLLSGKYPCRIEYAASQDKTKKHHLPLSEVTFGEALKDQGYQTCYVGKWHLGKEGGGPGAQGFDTVVHSGSAGATGSYFYPFPVEKGNAVDNPVEGKDGDYLNDLITDKAVEYVKEKKNKPFMMVLAHYAVHTPFEAPEELTKQYKKKLRKQELAVGGKRDDQDLVADRQGFTKTLQNNPIYAAMVQSTDQSLGRVVQAIKDAGIEDNTIIILTSDHGGLATRGQSNKRPLATSNAPFRQGKGSIFEGGTRVPLIIKWPGRVEGGGVSKVQVTGTDIYPTLLEMANAPQLPEQHVDGVSFVRALDGESYQRPPMFWYKWMARPDSTGDTRALALIDGPYKLVQWIDEDLVELFNLDEDPSEQTNLAANDPDRTKQMLAQITKLENEVGNLREQGKKMVDRRLERVASKTKKNKKANADRQSKKKAKEVLEPSVSQ